MSDSTSLVQPDDPPKRNFETRASDIRRAIRLVRDPCGSRKTSFSPDDPRSYSNPLASIPDHFLDLEIEGDLVNEVAPKKLLGKGADTINMHGHNHGHNFYSMPSMSVALSNDNVLSFNGSDDPNKATTGASSSNATKKKKSKYKANKPKPTGKPPTIPKTNKDLNTTSQNNDRDNQSNNSTVNDSDAPQAGDTSTTESTVEKKLIMSEKYDLLCKLLDYEQTTFNTDTAEYYFSDIYARLNTILKDPRYQDTKFSVDELVFSLIWRKLGHDSKFRNLLKDNLTEPTSKPWKKIEKLIADEHFSSLCEADVFPPFWTGSGVQKPSDDSSYILRKASFNVDEVHGEENFDFKYLRYFSFRPSIFDPSGFRVPCKVNIHHLRASYDLDRVVSYARNELRRAPAPISYQAILRSRDIKRGTSWQTAMAFEIRYLIESGAIIPVRKTKEMDADHILKTRWVFKRKLNENGSVLRRIAHLIIDEKFNQSTKKTTDSAKQKSSQTDLDDKDGSKEILDDDDIERDMAELPMDYDRVFESVHKYDSLRYVLARHAYHNRLALWHLDIREFAGDFFTEDEKSYFIEIPEGINIDSIKDKSDIVLRLIRKLPGLPGYEKLRSTALNTVLNQLGFVATGNDQNLFYFENKPSLKTFMEEFEIGSYVYLFLYVDDCIIVSPHINLADHVKQCILYQIRSKDLGDLTYFNDICFTRNCLPEDSDNSIKLDQENLIAELAERFLAPDSSPAINKDRKMRAKYEAEYARYKESHHRARSPGASYQAIVPRIYLPEHSDADDDGDEDGATEITMTPMDPEFANNVLNKTSFAFPNLCYDEVLFRLRRIAEATRPDIYFSVFKLQQFRSNPKYEHWKAMVRVIRYLQETIQYGLRYYGCTPDDSIPVTAFSSSDYNNDPTDRLAISGYVICISEEPISWSCEKQDYITTSDEESQFVALSFAARKVLFLRYVLTSLDGLRCEKSAKGVTETSDGYFSEVDEDEHYEEETLKHTDPEPKNLKLDNLDSEFKNYKKDNGGVDKSSSQAKDPKKNLTSSADDTKKSKTIEWIFKKGDFLPWVVFTDDIKVAGYIINPKESPMKNVPNKHLFASAIANQWLGKYIRFGGLDNGTKEKIIAKIMVAPLDIKTVKFVTSRLLNI